jgi:hypothetical protein
MARENGEKETVLSHLVQERGAGNAEQVRGLALVASSMPEHQRQVPSLRRLERFRLIGVGREDGLAECREIQTRHPKVEEHRIGAGLAE